MSPSTIATALYANGNSISSKKSNDCHETCSKSEAQNELNNKLHLGSSNAPEDGEELLKLFSNNAILKIWKTSSKHLAREVVGETVLI